METDIDTQGQKPPKTRRGFRQNKSGQEMGLKGQRTRRGLIDATVGLLDTVALRNLRVADIAREANVSSATFYLYFDDVAEVVLARLGEVTQSAPAILQMLREPWGRDDGERHARALVEAYVRQWVENRHLFRVRNLAAEEGDRRFSEIRELTIRPFLDALTDKISRARGAELAETHIEARSLAGVLTAMIERLAAVAGSSWIDDRALQEQHFVAAAHVWSLCIGFDKG